MRDVEDLEARLGGERTGSVRAVKKVALAAFVGSTVEWYDFFLYGTAAALVFGDLFFPDANPTVGTLAAFATFGVGFLFRPLGGPSSATSATASAARRCSSSRSC